MAVSLPRVGRSARRDTDGPFGGTHRRGRCGAAAAVKHSGGFWPVAPEGGVPDLVRCRGAAWCSAGAGPSTSEPGLADVLCTAQAFGVEVDEAVSGHVHEVRAAGQVCDVAHCGSFVGGLGPRRGDAGRERAAAPPILPVGDRRNGVGRSTWVGRWAPGGWSDHAAVAVCGVCAARPPFGPGSPWVSSWRGFGAWCPPGLGGAVLTRAGPRWSSRASSSWASPAQEWGFGQQKGRPLGRPREAWSHAVRVYRERLTARAEAIVRGQA